MRAINFWGGFLQGISQGVQYNQLRQRQDEELKLKQQAAKSALALHDLTLRKQQREESARSSLKDIIGQGVAPGTMPTEGLDPNILGRDAGDEPRQDLTPPGIREALVGKRQAANQRVGMRQAMVDIARPQDLPGLLGLRLRRGRAGRARSIKDALLGSVPANMNSIGPGLGTQTHPLTALDELALARQMGLSPEQYRALTGRSYPLAQQ